MKYICTIKPSSPHTPSEERSSREGYENRDDRLPQPGKMATIRLLML
ncbi:hypothetical protein KI659_07625 [Litoribacter alkaliphilus]|uniref:Uncharacterized protein n=1 Tax=Litoribacter ruber TaxID=702568 RepID=A0AAP2G1B5_9BACT|nr:hypothetical protein [Litoribacter alkaliphilus]MBS9523882.1 hypothetical protein [Litoribacter alkaliphilus]